MKKSRDRSLVVPRKNSNDSILCVFVCVCECVRPPSTYTYIIYTFSVTQIQIQKKNDKVFSRDMECASRIEKKRAHPKWKWEREIPPQDRLLNTKQTFLYGRIYSIWFGSIRLLLFIFIYLNKVFSHVFFKIVNWLVYFDLRSIFFPTKTTCFFFSSPSHLPPQHSRPVPLAVVDAHLKQQHNTRSEQQTGQTSLAKDLK